MSNDWKLLLLVPMIALLLLGVTIKFFAEIFFKLGKKCLALSDWMRER